MDDNLRGRFRRDFSDEVNRPPRSVSGPPPTDLRRPAQPQPGEHHQRVQELSPTSHHMAHHQPAHHAKPRRRRRIVVVLLTLLLIGAAAAGGYWYWSSRVSSPLPAATRASVSYPLLYPAKLPAGYQIDQTSYSSSGGVVVFSASNQSGGKLAFSVQKLPTTFNFNNFYTQLLKSPSFFNTPIGQGAVGTVNGKLLGSVKTKQTWMLVSATTSGIKATDLRFLIQNVRVSSR